MIDEATDGVLEGENGARKENSAGTPSAQRRRFREADAKTGSKGLVASVKAGQWVVLFRVL